MGREGRGERGEDEEEKEDKGWRAFDKQKKDFEKSQAFFACYERH